MIFDGDYDDHVSIIKFVRLPTEAAYLGFHYEVHAQETLHNISELENDIHIPKILAHYCRKHPTTNQFYGVIVMEKIRKTLFQCMKDDHDIEDIAEKMKHVVGILRKHGIVHGDLHIGNVGIDDDDKLCLIDFDYTVICCSSNMSLEEREIVYDTDVASVWRISLFDDPMYNRLNRALHAVDFPGSRVFRSAFGMDRPDPDLVDVEMADKEIFHRALSVLRHAQSFELDIGSIPITDPGCIHLRTDVA
jgi:serine/threonine protein kinase